MVTFSSTHFIYGFLHLICFETYWSKMLIKNINWIRSMCFILACKLQIKEGSGGARNKECIVWAEYSDNCSLVSTVAAVTWLVYSLIMQTYAKHPTWWSPTLATLDPLYVDPLSTRGKWCEATRRKREVCLCLITTITSYTPTLPSCSTPTLPSSSRITARHFVWSAAL